ncbi:MAG TPA: holo-ACP synthase [Tissierellaceae bacterium]|nr:holo-ACP synthase [Tissierellaceae bacterium]
MMSTGVDIVQISRIEKILKEKKDSFLTRIFTEKEIAYIKKKGNNPRTVAGLYASKEAISKALGTGIGQVSWQDLEIIHDDKGKPLVNLSAKLDPMQDELKLDTLSLSISHDGDYAIAFVLGYHSAK